MTRELDPEIQADLDLRESSVHDPKRTRKEPKWVPPVEVALWTCRRPRCPNVVGVTQEVVEQLETFNGYLRARAEREIPTNAVMLCSDCRREAAAYRVGIIRERHDELANVIRELKQSPTPRNEHDRIRKLEELRHPDIKGLLDALDEKLKHGSKRAREI